MQVLCLGAAFGEDHGRKRYDRALGVGQCFVDHAVAGDGGESRCALRTEDDEIGMLRTALIEQFFRRVAGHNDSLDGDLANETAWNKCEHAGLDIVERSASEEIRAVLRTDDVLQDQTRLVLNRQLGSKLGDDGAGLMKADRTKDGSRSEIAIATSSTTSGPMT